MKFWGRISLASTICLRRPAGVVHVVQVLAQLVYGLGKFSIAPAVTECYEQEYLVAGDGGRHVEFVRLHRNILV